MSFLSRLFKRDAASEPLIDAVHFASLAANEQAQ